MLAIVQARNSSQRLPGKVLREVDRVPVLGYLLDRLAMCKRVQSIIVATSDQTDDTTIERYCMSRGLTCIRGPLDDVAERFRLAIGVTKADAFVRISADSPVMDPAIVDRAVELFSSRACDLATNVRVRTFPKGQSVEVLKAATFLNACAEFDDARDKEHVTTYFYRHPDRFRIESFENERNLGDMSMAIDTLEDWVRFKVVIGNMTRPPASYGLNELIELYEQAA